MSDEIVYQDFEVNISKIGENEYALRVSSQGGRAEVRFTDTFTPERRQLIRQTLTMAALRSSARVRSASTAEVKTMKDVGATLFEQAFRDQARELYYQCLGQATQQGKGLRLRLVVDPALSDLPWEFLATPQKEFLGLDPKTPIIRYIELPTPVAALKAELPLRVLVVIASPKDQVPLDTAAEKARIAAALDPLEVQGLVQVSYIEGPDTWPRLIDALRPNETHILHYIGHGAFDEAHNEGVLLMESEQGTTRMVGSDEMRILMQGRTRLRLAILNSCLGTQASESEPFASLAAAMVRAGVPAVIAMQFEVSDRAAQIIAGTFYKSLALNFPVDAALTEARRQIALLDRDSLEWATPVLYMQVPDGQLFDITRKAEAGVASPSPEDERVSTKQLQKIFETMYTRAEQSYQAHKWEEALRLYKGIALQDPTYKQVTQRIAEIERILSGAAATPPAEPASPLPPPAPTLQAGYPPPAAPAYPSQPQAPYPSPQPQYPAQPPPAAPQNLPQPSIPQYPSPQPQAQPASGDERTYEMPMPANLAALAEQIRQYFFANGYETQALTQGTTVIVQGKKGGWRSLVGMSQAATVKLDLTPTGFKASVGGGKWLEQGAAMAVSMFVLWPLAITGGIGMAQQKMLYDTLWRMVETFMATQGGRRVA